MKKILIAFGFLSLSAMPVMAEQVPALEAESLHMIEGDDWIGTLTYLNYQEPFVDFTISAELNAQPIEGGIRLAYIYPDEPHANSTVDALVNTDGSEILGEPIVSNVVSESGAREVKTQFDCEDMGRAARCDMTYVFGKREVRIRKMVTYVGEAEGFRRNEFVFTR